MPICTQRMPHHNQKSTKAKQQRQPGQSNFGPEQFDTDEGSEYNDSETNELSSENETDFSQSIAAMQKL